VVVGWAIAWPIALGLVMAVAGFALVDRGLAKQGPLAAFQIVAGVALYIAAGLTYQTSALFAIMLLGAVLLVRDSASLRADVRWASAHLCALFGGLVAGFVAMNVVFTEGVVPEAARMAIEPHPLPKLLWFARNPLPNSLALFALRDRFNTPPSFWLAVAAVIVVAVLGLWLAAQNPQRRARWLAVALLLPFAAHSVSLAASSQAIGYRTLLPLSGLFLVLFVFGVRGLVERTRAPRAVEAVALGAFVLVGAVLARHNAFTLIAEPQGYEWQLIKSAADRVQLDGDTRVYLIRPSLAYRATRRMYADEYGSLTSDADWAAKEMFNAAMRQRFPNGLPEGRSYSLLTAFGPPPPYYQYDFVADLRELVNLGERPLNVAATTASRR
jgi:hypothetical protein